MKTSHKFNDGWVHVGDVATTMIGKPFMVIKRDDKDHISVLLDDGRIFPKMPFALYSTGKIKGGFYAVSAQEYLRRYASRNSTTK